MSLFDYAKENYSCYKDCLGYYYQTDLMEHPEKLDEINDCDFVFVESDYAEPIEGCLATQFMTSAEYPYTAMWLRQDYSSYLQLPHSEWTEVPTVGFVGRLPIFHVPVENGGKKSVQQVLHKGFMERAMALQLLGESNEVCSDFHVRYKPEGDSCGFWNDTLPGFKKSGPLFKTNMLAVKVPVAVPDKPVLLSFGEPCPVAGYERPRISLDRRKGLSANGQRRVGPYLLEILLRGRDHGFDTPEPRASVWNDTLVEPGEGPAHILQRTIQGPSFTDQLEKQPVEGDTLHFHRVLHRPSTFL